MPSRRAEPEDPTRLRRVGAGRHETGDGRFVVEQAANGWMLTDHERTNDFGLALTTGPFATLDAAREALAAARAGTAPTSDLPDRIRSLAEREPPTRAAKARKPAPPRRELPIRAPVPPPLAIRDYRAGDGPGLRELWEPEGMLSSGDDDAGLRLVAQRNPGLLRVATRGARIVGSAIGAWDGRRGWIYHVAVTPAERRAGLGRRLVAELETRLAELGCTKINLVVREGDHEADAFWERLGYSRNPNHVRHRTLAAGPPGPGSD